MKTFDEALEIFYREVPVTCMDDPQALEVKHTAEMDTGMVYRNDMMNDIVLNGKAQRFIESMHALGIREPNFGILVFALHAFAHGVAVGVEMEKQDLSGFQD